MPVVWAATVALELAQGQLAHSLVSRPERLFGASDSRWFAVLVVAGGFLLGLQLALVGGMLLRAERRRVARAAFAVAALAAAARYGVALFAPDPHLYEVSQARGLAALVLLICTPAALVLVGAGVGGRGRAFAWLSARLTLPMLWIAAGWTIWSARSGALQPQLWAVEPVEGLAGAWCGLAGLWLLGVGEWLRPRLAGLWWDARGPSIPGPGRKASAVLALLAAFGLIAVSAPFVRQMAPTMASQLAGRTQVETIRVGEIDRTYRLYRPTHTITAPGLVFVLHGVFGNGFDMESSTGFDAQADRLGWIVAYPDGVLDGWDAFGSGPEFAALTHRVWDRRGFGDFWGHMLVAEGIADVMFEPVLEIWDVAALIPIVEEAGGRVTDRAGARRADGGNAVTTNGVLHADVLDIVGVAS